MNEERYEKLHHQLLAIRPKFQELDECYSELKTLLKKNCLVNDHVIEEKLLSTIYEKQNNVKIEFNNVLLPKVSRNIRS